MSIIKTLTKSVDGLQKSFISSLSDEVILSSKIAEELKEFVSSDFERTAILKKYLIGATADRDNCYWNADEYGQPFSCELESTSYFSKPIAYGLHLLDEPSERLGICSTPYDTFWCNMFLRHQAIFISISNPSALDFDALPKRQTFTIL